MMRTRCPACSTIFRINPDQIKIRQGKVRCGQCQHIFNALDTLIADPLSFPAAPLEEKTAPRQHDALRPPSDSKPTANITPLKPITLAQPPLTATPPKPSAPPEPLPIEVEAVPPIALDEPIASPPQPEATAQVATPVAAETTENEDDTAIETVAETETAAEAETDNAPDTPATLTSLVEEAPVSRNWPWVSGLVLTLIALTVQAIICFRVEIATLVPDARPLLEAMCEPLECQVDLPRKVDLLGIDVSNLHPDPAQNNRLILSATLKNRAPFAQTYPHLEVTLTDVTDKPILRKVVAPDVYLTKEHPVAAGFPSNTEIPVELQLDPGELSAVGYRLYLFYP